MAGFRKMLNLVVEQGAPLSRAEARQVLTQVLSGESSDMEIAALLTALATRGETADELTGFAEAMRALAVPLPLTDGERASLVDTCGTGGDGLGTFNITTGSALVAVAAGAKVAKHGNRAVTSCCGSADVLEALGVPVKLSPEQAVECLRATGFMFLYAPEMHPALKRVQPIRRALGFRTIFNLAGPLTNPAGAPAQVIGVFGGLQLVAATLARLGVRHAFVVHGRDGLDELTLNGISDVAEVREQSIRNFTLEAGAAGLEPAPLSALAGCDAQGNATL